MSLPLPFRVLVEVTFHYDAKRLQYLFRAIRGLAGIPVERMEIVVSTNVDNPAGLERIRSLCGPLVDHSPWGNYGTLSIESYPALSHPWHLPWCHKHLILDRFLAEGSFFTHFVHIEDDLLLSLENLLYFVKYAERLRPHRLIPAFLRIEYNKTANQLRLVDQVGVVDFGARSKICVDDWTFVNPDYPYQAMFILDQAHAQEYVQSRSFDRERSCEVRRDWGLGERASMGLCFEAPPPTYWSRYVIPVDVDALRTPSMCWIYHLPNNYTENARTPFGKTQPEKMFSEDQKDVPWSPPTHLDNLVWKLRRLPTRLLRGKRDTGHGLVPPGLCPLCGEKPSSSNSCSRSGCPTAESAQKSERA